MHAGEARPGFGDRGQFPDLDALVYLNHAAMSPPSRLVRAACLTAVDDFARRGAGAWLDWRDQRERLRHKLARLIGADADEVALVNNTSTGVVDIALSLRWRYGDRVLLFAGEFPTNVTPWQRAAELFGLEVVFHDAASWHRDPEAALQRLDRELERGVRLCAISAVQFQTGLCVPLGEIARRCSARGAELFVDAIQAVGAVPIDVHALGIDYLACGGHKWLMAPEGTGFLYVRRERAAALRPAVASWLSHEDGTGFLMQGAGHLRHDRPLRTRADVFETGVTGSIGFAGMEAAVDALLELGPAAIHAYLQSILDPLETALVERGFASMRATESAARSGILAVRPPTGVDGASVWQALDERRVRCAYPDGFLRFSPHWPNDPAQVADVAAALDDGLRAIRR